MPPPPPPPPPHPSHSMSDDDGTISPKVVMLYVLGVLQAFCGYYLPADPAILWWGMGIGTFVSGFLYLQIMYSSHFFIDIPLASSLSMAFRHHTPHWCTSTCCYSREGQDVASFFFILFSYMSVYRSWSRSMFRGVVLIAAFLVYSIDIIVDSRCDPRIASLSIIVGALLGIAKVLGFRAFLQPLCEAIYKYSR